MMLAPLEPEVRNRTRGNHGANFGFAALAGYARSAAGIGHRGPSRVAADDRLYDRGLTLAVIEAMTVAAILNWASRSVMWWRRLIHSKSV